MPKRLFSVLLSFLLIIPQCLSVYAEEDDYLTAEETENTEETAEAPAEQLPAEESPAEAVTSQKTDATTPLTELSFGKEAYYLRTSANWYYSNYLKRTPSNSDSVLTVTSSDEDVAAVDGQSIYGKSSGVSKITVTSDNGLTASTDLHVGSYATSISYSTYSYKMKVNESCKLEYTLYPADSSDEKVSFTVTSGAGAVSVSEDGTVTALSAGYANVRAETLNGSYTTFQITVYEAPTSLSFKKDMNYLRLNYSGDIWNFLNCSPHTAYGYPLEVTSSNEEVISVADNTINAVGNGAATVTVKVNDITISATFNVGNYASSISYVTYRYNLKIGESAKLEYKLYPADVTDDKVTFTVTSGSEYVSVSEDGTVTALSAGTAYVKAEILGGNSTSFAITVYEVPTSLSFKKEIYYFPVNNYESVWRYLDYEPSGAYGCPLEVTSSNEEVVSISNKTTINAISAGTATVTVKAGDISTTATFNIGKYATNIVYVTYRHNMKIGESKKLEYTLYPADATDDKVTFSVTSGSEYVSVSEDGTVTALAAGTASVKAETMSGNYTTFSVNVYEAPTSLTFKKEQNYLRLNSTEYIWNYLNCEPASTSGYPLEITSSNEEVISVAENNIKAAGYGSAVVTVKAGEITVSSTFNVGNYATRINSGTYRYYLETGKSTKLDYAIYPTDSSDEKVSFTVTSGSECVSVSDDGTITALAVGSAYVRAETLGGSYTTFSITVYEAPSSLSFRRDNNYLRPESSGNIWNYLNYEPATAYGYPLEITSSNEEVISVTDTVIRAAGSGSAVVTVKAGEITASSTFNVGNYATRISYAEYNKYLKINDTCKLKYTLYPSNSDVSDEKVTFTVTSGSEYVSVSDDGTVTALSAGTAYVRAEILNGEYTTYTINAVSDPTALSFNKPANYLDKYSGHDIWSYLSYEPFTAFGYPLSITSSDTDIVEVSGTSLYGRSNGTAVITVSDGIGHTASASFTVGNYALRINQTNYSDIYLKTGSNLKLEYTLYPENGDFSDEQVVWSVASGSNYVSVSSDGTVTAMHGGYATVRAEIKNGASTQFYINVYDDPVSLDFKNGTNYLDKISSKNIWTYLNYEPETSYHCPLTVTSSNPEVLEVSGQSLFGRADGTATITVTAENGVTAKGTFTVGNYASSINRKGSSSIYLRAGESRNLEYTLYPTSADISDETVVWDITQKTHDCISVDQNGKVTAKRPGVASVRATIKNGGSTSYSVRVITAPDALSFKNRTNYLDKFNSRYIWNYLNCEPATTSDYPLTITSSDPDVIAVDGSNLIGKTSGSATITVTTENGLKASAAFTVGNYASSITNSMYSTYLTPGEETQLKYTLNPSNGDFSEELVKWSASDDLIGCITLDQNGNVKALKTGTVRVVAEIRNGAKTTFTVNVVPAPQRIAFTKTNYYVGIGGQRYVTNDVIVDSLISDGINLDISSDNPSAASIKNKTLTGNRKGTAIITVTDEDGASAKAEYNIGYYATALTPKDGSNKTMLVGDSLQLEYEISGAGDYSDDEFTWKLMRCSNDCIRLSESGVVTAMATGSAEVSVVSMSGAVARFTIYVTNKPTSITFDKSEYEIAVNRTIRLTAKVSPGSVIGPDTLVWESSDPSVAAIDYDFGLYANVIGLSEGTVTIKAVSAFDGSVYGECKLEVYEPVVPTAISIDSEITTYVGYSIAVPVTVEPARAGHYYSVTSSNSNIVCTPNTDDGTVKIDGKKAGTATITLTSEDKKASATAKVTVLEGTPEVSGRVSVTHSNSIDRDYYDVVATVSEYVFVVGEVYSITTTASFAPYIPDEMSNDFYKQLDSCGLFSDIRRSRASVNNSQMNEEDYVRAAKAGTAELKTLTGKTLKITVIDSAWLGTKVTADSSVPASFVNELKQSSLGIQYDVMYGAAPMDGLESLSVEAGKKAVVQSWLEVAVSSYQKDSNGNLKFVITPSAKAKVVSMASSASNTSEGTTLIEERSAEIVADLNMEIPVASIAGTSEYSDVTVEHKSTSGEVFTYSGFYDDSVIHIKSLNGYGTFTITAASAGESSISVNIYGTSLALEGKIGLNFYLEIPEEEKEYLSVVMTMNGKSESVPANKGTVRTISGKSYRMYEYPVAAKEMRDKITLTVKDLAGNKVKLTKDGIDYTEGYPYSASEYFARVEEVGQEKTKKLSRVLNNYGKYAQIYFDYKVTDEVKNTVSVADVTADTLESYKAVMTEETVDGLTYAGGSTMLDDAIGFRIYFKVGSGYDIKKYTFTIDNKAVTPEKSGSMYFVELADIAAKDLGVMHTIKATDGTKTFGIQYSALSYARRVLELTGEDRVPLQNMCRAMYLYNQQAIEYFTN